MSLGVRMRAASPSLLVSIVVVAASCAGPRTAPRESDPAVRPESTTSLAAYEINGAVPRSFQIYNVADLLAVGSGGSRLAGVDARQTAVEPLDPSSLMAHIRARSGGDAAWSDAQIEFSQGQLFVDASGGLHDQVRRILAELRRRKLEKPS